MLAVAAISELSRCSLEASGMIWILLRFRMAQVPNAGLLTRSAMAARVHSCVTAAYASGLRAPLWF